MTHTAGIADAETLLTNEIIRTLGSELQRLRADRETLQGQNVGLQRELADIRFTQRVTDEQEDEKFLLGVRHVRL